MDNALDHHGRVAAQSPANIASNLTQRFHKVVTYSNWNGRPSRIAKENSAGAILFGWGSVASCLLLGDRFCQLKNRFIFIFGKLLDGETRVPEQLHVEQAGLALDLLQFYRRYNGLYGCQLNR